MSTKPKPADVPKGRAVSAQELARDAPAIIARMLDEQEAVVVSLNDRAVAVMVPIDQVRATAANLERILAQLPLAPLDRQYTGRQVDEVFGVKSPTPGA